MNVRAINAVRLRADNIRPYGDIAVNNNLSIVPLLFWQCENALHPNGIEGVKYAVPPLIRHFLTKMPSRCQTTPLAVSGEPVLPYWKLQGGHSGRYFGALPCPLAPTGNSLEESGALTSSHHSVYRPILAKVGAFVKRKPAFPDNDKLVFERLRFKLPVIANQCAHWCGNPPVERSQVTITTKNRGDFHSFRY